MKRNENEKKWKEMFRFIDFFVLISLVEQSNSSLFIGHRPWPLSVTKSSDNRSSAT
jgi:hypothetical protein